MALLPLWLAGPNNMWWKRAQHHHLVFVHLPPSKGNGVLCLGNQPGQERKDGRANELFCLVYLAMLATNTLFVNFISLKVVVVVVVVGGEGWSAGRGVTSITRRSTAIGLAAAEAMLCLLLTGDRHQKHDPVRDGGRDGGNGRIHGCGCGLGWSPGHW